MLKIRLTLRLIRMHNKEKYNLKNLTQVNLIRKFSVYVYTTQRQYCIEVSVLANAQRCIFCGLQITAWILMRFSHLCQRQHFSQIILFVPYCYLVLHQKGLVCWSFFKNYIMKTAQASCCVHLIMFCTISNSYNTLSYYENSETESILSQKESIV